MILSLSCLVTKKVSYSYKLSIVLMFDHFRIFLEVRPFFTIILYEYGDGKMQFLHFLKKWGGRGGGIGLESAAGVTQKIFF